MAKINLLPWREERRQQRKREFLAMLGAVAVASAILVFGAQQFFQLQLDRQQERIGVLDSEIKLLDVRIEKIKNLEAERDALLQRQRIIEKLQADRSTMVHVFDEIVGAIPDGVFLTELTQKGSNLELKGRGQSYARISRFMTQLESSPWLRNLDLNVIARAEDAKATNEQRPMSLASLRQNFVVKMQITNPNVPAEETEGAATPIQQGRK